MQNPKTICATPGSFLTQSRHFCPKVSLIFWPHFGPITPQHGDNFCTKILRFSDSEKSTNFTTQNWLFARPFFYGRVGSRQRHPFDATPASYPSKNGPFSNFFSSTGKPTFRERHSLRSRRTTILEVLVSKRAFIR